MPRQKLLRELLSEPGQLTIILLACTLAVTALNPADYPALDVVPPIDSDLMKQWIAEAKLDTVPDIPVNGENGCSNTTVNAQAVTDATSDGNCELPSVARTACESKKRPVLTLLAFLRRLVDLRRMVSFAVAFVAAKCDC